MNPNDVVFEKNDKRFNYRSVAVIIHDEKILLHQIGDNPYWSLPGGRVEFLEDAANAVIREMKEEILVDCKVVRPLWVIENFFDQRGYKVHEIAFYFLVSCPVELLEKGSEFEYVENSMKLHFAWVPLNLLNKTELYPASLRTALNSIPSSLEYIVHHG
jgi:ADP-ribose pyrophosphatase YjhB (NUDIX family)